jgi:hypothetical protein
VQASIQQLTGNLQNLLGVRERISGNATTNQDIQARLLASLQSYCDKKNVLTRDRDNLRLQQRDLELLRAQVTQLTNERISVQKEVEDLRLRGLGTDAASEQIRLGLRGVQEQIQALTRMGADLLQDFNQDAARFEVNNQNFQTELARLQAECDALPDGTTITIDPTSSQLNAPDFRRPGTPSLIPGVPTASSGVPTAQSGPSRIPLPGKNVEQLAQGYEATARMQSAGPIRSNQQGGRRKTKRSRSRQKSRSRSKTLKPLRVRKSSVRRKNKKKTKMNNYK